MLLLVIVILSVITDNNEIYNPNMITNNHGKQVNTSPLKIKLSLLDHFSQATSNVLKRYYFWIV